MRVNPRGTLTLTRPRESIACGGILAALPDPRAAEVVQFSSRGFTPRIKDAFTQRAPACSTGVSALSSSDGPGSGDEPRSSSNALSDNSSSHEQQLR